MDVLVVEDNQDIAKQLIDLIKDFSNTSIEFTEAISAESAIKAISENDYKFIILDGRLVGSHGKDVLLQMSEKERRKTIVHSAEVSFLIEASKMRVDVCKKGDYESLVELIKQKLIVY